ITVKIFHNGNEEGFSEFKVRGTVVPTASVRISANHDILGETVPIAPLGPVQVGSTPQYFDIYLHGSGTGVIKFTSATIEGADEFTFQSYGLLGRSSPYSSSRYHCTQSGANTTYALNGKTVVLNISTSSLNTAPCVVGQTST